MILPVPFSYLAGGSSLFFSTSMVITGATAFFLSACLVAGGAKDLYGLAGVDFGLNFKD